MKPGTWFLIALAGLLGLVLISSIAVDRFVTAAAVQNRVNEFLGQADGGYRVRIQSVDAGPFGRSVRAEEVTLIRESTPVSSRSIDGLETTAARARSGLAVTIPAIELSGIELLPLLIRHELRASTLSVIAPVLKIVFDTASERSERSAGGHDPPRRQLLGLSRVLPRLALGTVSIDRARVSFASATGVRFVLNGLSLTLRDVRVDSLSAQDPDRTMFAQRFDLRLDQFRRTSSDGLSELILGPLHAASGECAVAGRLEFRPTVSDSVFQSRLTHRQDRAKVFGGPLSFCFIAYGRLATRGDLLVGRAVIDSLFVDVFSDRRLPPPPGPNEPWRLHDLLQRWPGSLRADSVRLGRADIFYSEHAPGAPRPGSISFREIDATITDLNTSARAAPTKVKARGLLAGASRIQATIELGLASEIDLRYRGAVGPMDARQFNPIVRPVEGFEFTDGQADSAWFDVEVRDGSASGVVVVAYNGLEVRVVGTDGDGTDLIEGLTTLIARTQIRRANPAGPNESLRVGTADYALKREDTFFQILWNPLRQGLVDLLGL